MPPEDKADEQKTERFNMFMSPSEMKAIDDWAWKKRIRSKSEAVRRLVQIGIRVADPDFNKRVFLPRDGLRTLRRLIDKGRKDIELAAERGSDAEEVLGIMTSMLDGMDKAYSMQVGAFVAMMSLLDEVTALQMSTAVGRSISVEDASASAKAIREGYDAGNPDIVYLVNRLLQGEPKEDSE